MRSSYADNAFCAVTLCSYSVAPARAASAGFVKSGSAGVVVLYEPVLRMDGMISSATFAWNASATSFFAFMQRR